MKKIISLIIKIILIVSVIVGIIFCFVSDEAFMNKGATMLYFTIQSNIWIAIIDLIGLILIIINKNNRLNTIFKLMFTVSITLTGLVYNLALAPLLSNPYNVQNTLLHVVTPILGIVDWFLIDDSRLLKKYDFIYSIIPPIYYLIFASIGYVAKWDFGNGSRFPYFFLNWGSKVGAFGFDFNSGNEYFMGVVYWVILITIFVIGVSLLFSFLNKKIRNKYN